MGSWRIFLADDHRLFRSGLRKILTDRSDLAIVGEAGDGLTLLRRLDKAAPDMVILDISMPKLRGIEATFEIKAARPGLKVLILTMHKDVDYLQSALNAGADGYLLKEDADDALFTAIDTIRAGRSFISPSLTSEMSDDLVRIIRGDRDPSEDNLTPREKSVLTLIAEGRTSRKIAELLCISPRTVEHHRANTMKKLKVKSLADLLKYAIRKGYMPDV